MAIQFVFIPNDETQNYPICRLQLKVETFDTQHHKSNNKIQDIDVAQ